MCIGASISSAGVLRAEDLRDRAHDAVVNLVAEARRLVDA
jgi:hypothetical protein